MPRLSIVPANADLVGLESELMAEPNRPYRLRDAVARLSAEQAARLAAMIPSPRRFERNPGSEYLDGRVDTILARMPAAEVP